LYNLSGVIGKDSNSIIQVLCCLRKVLKFLGALPANYKERDPWNAHFLLRGFSPPPKFKHVLDYKRSGPLSLLYSLEFLQHQCQPQRRVKAITKKEFKKPGGQKSIFPKACAKCNKDCLARYCPDLLGPKEEEQISWAQSSNLGLSCLNQGHRTMECGSKFACRYCEKKDNTVLHKLDSNLPIDKQKHKVVKSSTLYFNGEEKIVWGKSRLFVINAPKRLYLIQERNVVSYLRRS
jgi:hypothetical protein